MEELVSLAVHHPREIREQGFPTDVITSSQQAGDV